jgi:hypothetical protein
MNTVEIIKPVDVFLDMYQFTVVVCPLNTGTKELAEYLRGYIREPSMVTDVMPKRPQGTVIVYETGRTNVNDLITETPPDRICLVVGLGTRLSELNLDGSNVPLVYASVCEVQTSFRIREYPMSVYNDNTEFAVDSIHHVGPISIDEIIELRRKNSDVYVYYNEYNRGQIMKTLSDYRELMREYTRLVQLCSLTLENTDDGPSVVRRVQVQKTTSGEF